MGTTIYKFGGRLLVQEDTLLKNDYHTSGVPFRIGGIRTIESVISVAQNYERHGLKAPIDEVRVSADQLFVVMRRGDLPVVSLLRGLLSTAAAYGLMSGLTSGLTWLAELVSGASLSGFVTVKATVVGY